MKTESWRGLLTQLSEDAPELAPDLEALRASFERETAEVTRDAKRRMAELKEVHNANRLVTVGTLTMGMAHEFGTPLGIVLARAQMIASADADAAEARGDAEEIVRQVKRMSQMCREVLEYARPRAPAKVLVDVVVMCRQMIALLLFDARKRSVKLKFLDGAPKSEVLADASKLMQIITNLVINAAQAMPSGGTATVKVERRAVQPPPVTGLPEAEYICIQVTDVGTGVRGADLPHIFDAFFTTKIAGEGSGLGLAVSYRIAREHGGWIGVETEEGKGSTFTLFLPPVTPSPQ